MKTSEHYNKYEALSQKIGIEKLLPLIEDISEEKINTCFVKDKYLNNIPLRLWDKLAGKVYLDFPEYNHDFSMFNSGKWEWFKIIGNHSLADRVCILKHVAKYHKAKIKPESEELV